MTGDPVRMSLWAGRAYLETGEPGLARAELQQAIVSYEPLHGLNYWNLAWYYLARAQEGLDNRGDAIASYSKFLYYWGEADRPLPEIEDARRRLATLQSIQP